MGRMNPLPGVTVRDTFTDTRPWHTRDAERERCPLDDGRRAAVAAASRGRQTYQERRQRRNIIDVATVRAVAAARSGEARGGKGGGDDHERDECEPAPSNWKCSASSKKRSKKIARPRPAAGEEIMHL